MSRNIRAALYTLAVILGVIGLMATLYSIVLLAVHFPVVFIGIVVLSIIFLLFFYIRSVLD